MNMIALLTTINVVIFIGWLMVARYLSISWRSILAILPTPMLGFASSYGVYAYNERLTQPWVAIVMAAAYEVTYCGIAAFVNLSTTQVDKGDKIARDAAFISFAQNTIAALFYVQPGLLVYNERWGTWALMVNIPLSLLHAAQVWIAYRAANFTLHGSRSTTKLVTVDKKPTIRTVDTPAPSPTAPPALPSGSEAPVYQAKVIRVDGRAAAWHRMHADDGMTYQQIADAAGLSKSFVNREVNKYLVAVNQS